MLCLYRGRDHQDSDYFVFDWFLEKKKDFAVVHGFLSERARYLREGISLYSGTT